MKKFIELLLEFLFYLFLAMIIILFIYIMHDIKREADIYDKISEQIKTRNNTAIINYNR